MKNPMGMLKQVQQMQAKMAAVQADLESTNIEATAGGGVVTAVVTGGQKLVSISISPEVLGDADMLPDLIVAAVNEALDKSRALAAQKMQAVTAGLGLPPGLL
jgi:DNA-binding YbaB/EbfC family protein